MDKPIAVENCGPKAKVITPDDGGHYFFGYYDIQPFDSTGKYHLCHKAPFENRLPNENDICELGVIDIQNRSFIKLAETTAWNFQQGAFLRWYKDDNHILFNIRENGAYRCCILNIKTNKKKILPMAVADVSGDGKWGLCINFSRVYDFRPGYGYAGIKDPYYGENAPKKDGIFIMDMESGSIKLIVTYEKLRSAFPKEPFSSGKLLINHINFNPSGTRYVILLRNFREAGMSWKTQLITGDLEGNLHCLANFSFQSHYHWKNDEELLIFGGFCEEQRDDGLWLFTDKTSKAVKLSEPNPKKDIHCLYSPNRRYIMGDGYPDAESYRLLHFIDTSNNTDTILGKYLSYISNSENVDFRCDLHARFDRTGRYASFDTIHTGKRTICILDLSKLDDYDY